MLGVVASVFTQPYCKWMIPITCLFDIRVHMLSFYVVPFGALLFLSSAFEFWVLGGGSIFSHTNPLSSFVSDRCRQSWSSGSRGRGPILPYLMQLGSFFWNCVRVFRVKIYYYVTQWSATRFYGSLSVYNRPIPSEKIAPWQPSQSRRPAILVHFKAICFLWLLSFSIKIPRKSSGILEEVTSLDFLTQASRGHACSLESKRSPAAGERCERVDKHRTMAEGNSEMPCGYDEDFVNRIDEDLQCSICYVALREPVLTRCGHRFCKECLERHMERYVEHIMLLSYFAAWL